MVNKKEIQELIQWYDELMSIDPNMSNYPWFERDLYDPFMEALGDDEDEIIEYISNADEETQSHMCSIVEKLSAKFPSDKMEDFLDNLWKVEQERVAIINANFRANFKAEEGSTTP